MTILHFFFLRFYLKKNYWIIWYICDLRCKKNSQDVIVLFIDESLTFKNKAVYAR